MANDALARLLANFDGRLSAIEATLKSMQTPSDLPGFKHPYLAVLPMTVAASTATVRSSFTVSTSGPFVLTGWAAFWRETSQALFRPVSSLTEPNDASPEVNAIDFEYEISIGGAGWNFQSDGVPSAFLFSNLDRPKYLTTEYVLKGNEAVTVAITPISTPNAAGTLYFCLLGYKILSVNAYGNLGEGQASLESIPGRRVPYTAVIDIASAATTAQRTGQWTNSQTGLFVVTSLGAAYRETSQGRYRPISSVTDNQVASPVVNAIDFLWQLRTTGNDLNWQSDRVPSPLLFTNQERPFYLSAPAQIPPNSTVYVTVDPIVAPAQAGTLHFIMDGYLIAEGT